MISSRFLSQLFFLHIIICLHIFVGQLRYPNWITYNNQFTNTPVTNSALLGRFGSIFVPEEDISYFKSAAGWSSISGRFASIPREIRKSVICANACLDVRNSIYYNEDVKVVGYSAFEHTLSASITMPNCECIAGSAFCGQRLKYLSIPKVKYVLDLIGAYGFGTDNETMDFFEATNVDFIGDCHYNLKTIKEKYLFILKKELPLSTLIKVQS